MTTVSCLMRSRPGSVVAFVGWLFMHIIQHHHPRVVNAQSMTFARPSNGPVTGAASITVVGWAFGTSDQSSSLAIGVVQCS